MTETPVRIEIDGCVVRLQGELNLGSISQFEAQLAALRLPSGPLQMELTDFDIGDSAAAVAAVSAVRRIARLHPLILRHAPRTRPNSDATQPLCRRGQPLSRLRLLARRLGGLRRGQ